MIGIPERQRTEPDFESARWSAHSRFHAIFSGERIGPSLHETRKGFSVPGNDAAEARAETASHVGLGRELRGHAGVADHFGERREHRHGAAGEDAGVARSGIEPPPQRLRHEALLAEGAVVARENRLSRNQAVEARPDGELPRVSPSEVQVAVHRGRPQRREEQREWRRADPAGHDRDARPGSEVSDRKRVAEGTEEAHGRTLGEDLERGRAGTDGLDQELDLPAPRIRVRHRVRAPQVGAHPVGNLDHRELSGENRRREVGAAEGHGKEAGREEVAPQKRRSVVGLHRAGILSNRSGLRPRFRLGARSRDSRGVPSRGTSRTGAVPAPRRTAGSSCRSRGSAGAPDGGRSSPAPLLVFESSGSSFRYTNP